MDGDGGSTSTLVPERSEESYSNPDRSSCDALHRTSLGLCSTRFAEGTRLQLQVVANIDRLLVWPRKRLQTAFDTSEPIQWVCTPFMRSMITRGAVIYLAGRSLFVLRVYIHAELRENGVANHLKCPETLAANIVRASSGPFQALRCTWLW